MRTNVRYARLIPMVRGVLDTLDRGIEEGELAAAELAGLAYAMPGDQKAPASALLQASRQHAIGALEMRGKRSALLAQYGLE